MRSLRKTILDKRNKLKNLSAAGYSAIDIAKEIDITAKFNIFELYQKIGVKASYVAEIGPATPELAQCRDELTRQAWQDYLIKNYPHQCQTPKDYSPGRFLLVEAREDATVALGLLWGHLENVEVLHGAIADTPGFVEMNWVGDSTFTTGVASPFSMNPQKKKSKATFVAPCERFSEIDDGTIDTLIVDIEGAEWFVIKHMKSKPLVVSLETHSLNPSCPEHEYIN